MKRIGFGVIVPPWRLKRSIYLPCVCIQRKLAEATALTHGCRWVQVSLSSPEYLVRIGAITILIRVA